MDPHCEFEHKPVRTTVRYELQSYLIMENWNTRIKYTQEPI